MTYRIIRNYQNAGINRRTIETGLTLEQVQAHCSDPETSSSTCTSAIGLRRTEKVGAWFDGYASE